MNNMSKPYFYIIEHIASNRYYAGVRIAKNCNKNELLREYGYQTSSKVIKQIIKDEGLDSFKINRIREFNNKNDAINYEFKFLQKVKARSNKKFLNLSENENSIQYINPEDLQKLMYTKYGYKYASQIPEFKEKFKQTCLKNFGVTNPLKNIDIRLKAEKTNLRKYGFKFAIQSNIIKEKSKNTCLQKYGSEIYFASDNFKEKFKQTNLQKYGVEHFMQSDEYRKITSERQLGDKHHSFNGYYITPFGTYGSSHEAARNNEFIDRKCVAKWCKNSDKIISKLSYNKNLYLQNTFDNTIIGKTFKDIGFSFNKI